MSRHEKLNSSMISSIIFVEETVSDGINSEPDEKCNMRLSMPNILHDRGASQSVLTTRIIHNY